MHCGIIHGILEQKKHFILKLENLNELWTLVNNMPVFTH